MKLVHRRASHLDKKDQKIMKDARKIFKNYMLLEDGTTWWITGEFTDDPDIARTRKRRPLR